MRLNGKKALITAAGQGIGRAICKAYSSEGADVLATDINLNLLQELEGSAVCELDVTNKKKLQNCVVNFNPDILVNCAGIVHNGSITQATDEEFNLAFDLNVKAIFHSIQAVIPLMIKKGGGSIINVSSVVSSIIGAPNRFVYGVTKAALIGLTKSVSVEYVKEGIRCNAICPGTVDTPSLHQRLEDTGTYNKSLKTFIDRQPMQRLGKDYEIAALATYLGSDESKFTTGQSHIIDGGWTAG
jgi:2-keto-3-deoxy-L-fuconate dehydrogenase